MRSLFVLFNALLLAPAGAVNLAVEVQAGQFSGGTKSNLDSSLFQPIMIDFDDIAEGTLLTGYEWADKGVEISLDSNRELRDGSGDLPLTLYNSSCRPRGSKDKSLPKCKGGDHDLATGEYFGTEAQGNVLIIQEDNSHKKKNKGTLGAPDDDRKGGLITFNFMHAVTDVSLGFLDFDERTKGYLRFFAGADDTEAALKFDLSDVSALVNPDIDGDNSMRIFQGLNMSFQKIEVEYPGSGAITHLEFTKVAPGGSEYWSATPEAYLW
ncbi:MAG: hypothetical protein ACFBSG_12560 [Leptolyngbyaceae cyanobacterium]